MLRKIPERYFELAGVGCGFMGCATIATQVCTEVRIAGPSTLSPVYTIGFLLIFIFWTLYGVRFRRYALWLTNGIATVLQTVLVLIVLLD